MEWFPTRWPAETIWRTPSRLFAAQFPVRKKVAATLLAVSAERILGRPAALAPASNVKAMVRPAPGMTVRSWFRNWAGKGSGGGTGRASGGVATGGGGRVAGGCTGVWPSSGGTGAAVPVVWGGNGIAADPEGAEPGGLLAAGVEAGPAIGGGLPAGVDSRTASTTAIIARAAASAIAAARRCPVSGTGFMSARSR